MSPRRDCELSAPPPPRNIYVLICLLRKEKNKICSGSSLLLPCIFFIKGQGMWGFVTFPIPTTHLRTQVSRT